MAILGNNILVSSNGTVIAATKSNEIQSSCETIEVSSATNGMWKTFVSGLKEWRVTVSFLVMNASDVQKLLIIGNTYNIAVFNRGTTEKVSGSAILQDCKITATVGNIANGSFTFRGTGPLT